MPGTRTAAPSAAVATARPAGADTARKLICAGQAPAGLQVSGKLSFADNRDLSDLPPGLSVGTLDLTNCTRLRALPPDLRVRRLILGGTWNPQHLLGGVRCYEL